MCAIFCIMLLIVGCINRDPSILTVSGLFGIGYAIERLADSLKQK